MLSSFGDSDFSSRFLVFRLGWNSIMESWAELPMSREQSWEYLVGNSSESYVSYELAYGWALLSSYSCRVSFLIYPYCDVSQRACSPRKLNLVEFPFLGPAWTLSQCPSSFPNTRPNTLELSLPSKLDRATLPYPSKLFLESLALLIILINFDLLASNFKLSGFTGPIGCVRWKGDSVI